MSIILKLDKVAQGFILGLNNGNKGRDKTVSVALARSIAYTLQLIDVMTPEEAVSAYRTTHRVTVERIVSDINEVISLDTSSVLTYVESFFCFRTEQIFSNTPVLAVNPETAIVDFFKISKYFDKDILSVIASDSVFVTSLCNNFSNVLKQIVQK